MELTRLLDIVSHDPVPVDRPFRNSMRFTLTGTGPTTRMVLDDLDVGPLPMYQVKAASGRRQINIQDFSSLVKTARGTGESADKARGILEYQASELNDAIGSADLEGRRFLVRVDDNRIGGVVSSQYRPFGNVELLERLIAAERFEGATIVKYRYVEGTLRFMLLMQGHSWNVDGGLKSGMSISNGQFGDHALSMTAMLFRLLCTNGMMSVDRSQGFSSRHTGSIDFNVEHDRVASAALDMATQAQRIMEIRINVAWALVELYRRGIIGRGPLRVCLDKIRETFAGIGVEGSEGTLWGLVQAIAAAARGYAYEQSRNLSQLAGEIYTDGTLETKFSRNPIIEAKGDWQAVLTETGHSI